ncbi:MAG: multidrug MFS transporter, partial [Paracoccaceae bacterium]
GHIAGLAATVLAAVSSVAAVFFGGAVGLAFNGTPTPLVLSVSVFAAVAWLLMRRTTADTEEENASA